MADAPREPSEREKALRQALAFAASVIKSGEPWTSECERIIGGALRDDAHAYAARMTPRMGDHP